MAASLRNPNRSHGGQYHADLWLDGKCVGRVERAMNMGGYRASDYKAIVGGTTVATGHTLDDLRVELRDPEVLADLRAVTA
jgi:hypothetical protein